MTPPAGRAIPLPRLAAALCSIALLAVALPYFAVRLLHDRRLERADRELQAIAAEVTALLASSSGGPGAQLLFTAGTRPQVLDDRWTAAAALPLVRVTGAPGPDPWGNAYLVNLADRRNGWVISAGPDGILQTPFPFPPDQPAGDDRLTRLR